MLGLVTSTIPTSYKLLLVVLLPTSKKLVTGHWSLKNCKKMLRGHYQIVKELGSGGFGATYLAQDMNLPGNPYCVVKHLKPQDPSCFNIAKRLFEKEAETLYRLGNHDQIPRLLAHFQEKGEFYLVQEFIEGWDLTQEILPGQPWSEIETKKLLKEILTVLAVVHENNVIHRDLKPANIMRRQIDGKLVLIDFGAVKEINVMTVNQKGNTSLTVNIGSLGYRPPEQAMGKPKLCSDIYAVGIMGISALTGLKASELQEDPETGEILWRDGVSVSEDFGNILTKMVKNYFPGRYKNVGEALQAFSMETSSLLSTIISAPSTPPLNPISSPSSSISFVRTLKGHTWTVNSVAISSDGSTIVSGSDDKTIKIWDLATGTEKRTLTGHIQWVHCIAISPDGSTIVSGSYDNTIKIWDLATGTEKRTLTGHTLWVDSVAISPDGSTMVSGSRDNTIKVWDLATGTEKRTLSGHTDTVLSVAISPDGSTIVSGSRDKTIKIWDLATLREKRTLSGHTSVVNSVAISPDGSTMVSGGDDKTIKVWDLATLREKRTLTGHTDTVLSVAISPDGSTIISGSGDKTIKVWDLATLKEKRTLTGHTNAVKSVAISADGSTIVSGSWDKTIKVWQVT